MVSFPLRQGIFSRPIFDTRPVSFRLSQFALPPFCLLIFDLWGGSRIGWVFQRLVSGSGFARKGQKAMGANCGNNAPNLAPVAMLQSHPQIEHLVLHQRTCSIHGRSSIPPRQQCFRSGFTLLELLTVLAIAALLLALLVPWAKNGVEAAKSAKCLGNLRQLSAEIMTHVNDKGFFPPMVSQIEGANGGDDFYTYLRTLPSKACAICPSAKFTGFSANGRPQEGYGANPMIMPNYQGNKPPLVRPAQIKRPAEVVLLTDGAQFSANGFALGFSTIWSGIFNGTIQGNPSEAEKPLTAAQVMPGGFWDPDVSQIPLRHNGRANILFCDGHVTSISAISDLKQKNIYWNY